MKKRDKIGLEWARRDARYSKRPVQVGAAIMARNGEIHGSGWNQLPYDIAETKDAHSRTLHAEVAAILDTGDPVHATLYVTCPVCHHCAPIVIHAGISRVVTLPPPPGLADWYADSFVAARAMFAEARVECVEVSE